MGKSRKAVSQPTIQAKRPCLRQNLSSHISSNTRRGIEREKLFWPTKMILLPAQPSPLLRDDELAAPSPPSKHNMKPQNLIPPSLLIFGPLGGYDCGAALTAASRRQKGNGLPNDIFVAHPSPSPPLPPHHGDIYLRFSHYFSKKRRAHSSTKAEK